MHVQAAPAGSHASPVSYVPVCGLPVPGYARCNLVLRIGSVTPQSGVISQSGGGPPQSTCATIPSGGYAPCDLQAAYNLPTATAGIGQTVAVVDAYDDPNAEFDLGVYRAHFGLRPCTTANGCFRKVNKNGVQGKYPSPNAQWSLEISADLEMVSAICPNCHILLVEAKTTQNGDMEASVDEAAALRANAISNSYGLTFCKKKTGCLESSTELNINSYNHPGIAITASTGDNGYGPQFPATSPFVTAVGGTELFPPANNNSWTETVWNNPIEGHSAGDGCSAYEPQPLWQKNLTNITLVCSNRAEADVSAVADNVAIFDTYKTLANWQVVYGTSLSSPIIAGVYALAGNESSITYGSYPYSHTSSLNDVTIGSIGCVGGGAFCDAQPGWDGPTGLGTPNGIGGF